MSYLQYMFAAYSGRMIAMAIVSIVVSIIVGVIKSSIKLAAIIAIIVLAVNTAGFSVFGLISFCTNGAIETQQKVSDKVQEVQTEDWISNILK